MDCCVCDVIVISDSETDTANFDECERESSQRWTASMFLQLEASSGMESDDCGDMDPAILDAMNESEYEHYEEQQFGQRDSRSIHSDDLCVRQREEEQDAYQYDSFCVPDSDELFVKPTAIECTISENARERVRRSTRGRLAFDETEKYSEMRPISCMTLLSGISGTAIHAMRPWNTHHAWMKVFLSSNRSLTL